MAWAASLGVEALTRRARLTRPTPWRACGRRKGAAGGLDPYAPFRQVRGALRVAQHRPDEALADLLAVGEGWQVLGVTNPAVASWRTAAVAAYRALGQPDEAAALAGEQLALARKAGRPLTLGIALRVHGDLVEAIGVLESGPARYELALALADHGASLAAPASGRGQGAAAPRARSRERTGAAGLAAEVKRGCSRPGPGPGGPP